jgi:WD40 repeat protein
LFSAGDSIDGVTARQWDKNTGTLIKTFVGVRNPYEIGSLAVTDDGQYLFAGTQDLINLVLQWQISDGTKVRTIDGHSDTVISIKVSNGHLFTASYDKTVKEWDILTGDAIKTFFGKYPLKPFTCAQVILCSYILFMSTVIFCSQVEPMAT